VLFNPILQLANFLGHHANAARWQACLAPLVCLRLRCLSHVANWVSCSSDDWNNFFEPFWRLIPRV
jgi:hypothetical protein